MTQTLDSLNHRVFVDRIIYATITMMSVLIIYDGWQTLKLIDVVGVIVGPVLAMFLSHVFSGAMAKHIEAGRILTGQEWMRVVASETPFLLLCVPPLVIVAVLFALGVSLTDSIQVVVWFGTATLGYWGFVAGRRAGFVGWRLGMVVDAGAPDRGGHPPSSGPSSTWQGFPWRGCSGLRPPSGRGARPQLAPPIQGVPYRRSGRTKRHIWARTADRFQCFEW